MRILIVHAEILPVTKYGGIERVIWYLARELNKLGHEVSFLAKKGSYCDFATVHFIDENIDLLKQIPGNIDIIYFTTYPKGVEKLKSSYVISVHGNSNDLREFDRNTIFVSKNHAQRYGSDSYVYNGLDWDDYTPPLLEKQRSHFHFLGKAAWRVKNVQGAINMIRKSKNEKLEVLGGKRLNIKMGLRLTLTPKVRFRGMVGGSEKDFLLNGSKGLIFPVRWHEPFGLAITESLYYGCPVFGTPYGSLPELITEDFGYLSSNEDELTAAIQNSNSYSHQKCHEYALEEFNSKKMALAYLNKFEKVLNGESLNENRPRLLRIQEDKFLRWK